MEKMTAYIKEEKTFKEVYTTTDPETIYNRLSRDLIAKKLNACLYIRSIKRENLYNGYQKITVTDSNGAKTEYIIKE
jgi:uncharacterized protein involved in tolerance to divalent cations